VKRRMPLLPHRRPALARVAERQPLICALALVAVWGGPIFAYAAFIEMDLDSALLYHGAMAAFVVLLLTWLGWWREAGFCRWRNPGLLILPAAMVVAYYRGVALSGVLTLTTFGLLALLISFQEEAWHRGIILRALVPAYGVKRAAAVGAVLFAAVHVVQMFHNASVGASLFRAVSAGILGYILTVVRLRTGSIWPGMLLTCLLQYVLLLGRGGLVNTGLLPMSPHQLGIKVLTTLVVFAWAVRTLRRLPTEPVLLPQSAQAS